MAGTESCAQMLHSPKPRLTIELTERYHHLPMLARYLLETLLPVILVCTVGCMGPGRGEYQSARAVSAAGASEEADRLWEAAQETLRRHRFQLDRVDRREGVITTLPVTSQHIFEFWRHDVATWSDLCESTLNPIRRSAEVTLGHGDDESSWNQLAVVVRKERLSSPDRQFNSTGAAQQYFGDSLPSTTGIVRVTAEHETWLDMGRDPAMEQHLLNKILERAGMDNAAESHGTGPNPG